MGLDNIPRQYPCKLKNTAILDSEGRIDCMATQEVGGCTWKTEKEKNQMLSKAVPVYGMLGTDCWYRGKYGNYLLEKMKNASVDFDNEIEYDFYGDIFDGQDEDEGISQEACEHMSDIMTKYTEKWIEVVDEMIEIGEINSSERESTIYDWIYATWWLKFVGENAEGSGVWY